MDEVITEEQASAGSRSRLGREGFWYAAAVVTGAVLIVVAAINQPYNQNELLQMAPYGSSDIGEITSGTRQPPLDPLLGAMVQHLLGEGQLRQRLVPIVAGIGMLILMSLLLRRLKTGLAGAFGVWILATAPLMVRYSGYTRPYALPLFLMMVFAYAAQRWLDDRRPAWLVLVGLPAAALPMVRVPEPTVFLVTATAVFGWLGFRHRRPWSDLWPLMAVSMGALVFIGLPMYAALASRTGDFFDPSPSGVIDRFGAGVDEIWHGLLPLLTDYLPWWPVTILLAGTVLVLPAARRQLSQWWMWWPVLAAPVVFVLAYHFMNTFSFDIRPYRARFAYFFLPALVLVVVAIANVLRQADPANRLLRVGVGALLVATFVGQLPATARVVLENESPDYGQVAEVLTEHLPADAIVVYDAPSPAGLWRQESSAKPRYMGDTPFSIDVLQVPSSPRTIPMDGPVYMLILDSRCAVSVVCDMPAVRWNHAVDGWDVMSRFDRFTLYAPTKGQSGRDGVIQAMRAFGRAFGPDVGYIERFAAARLLQLDGHRHQARALIQRMYDRADPEAAERIREAAERRDVNPLGW